MPKRDPRATFSRRAFKGSSEYEELLNAQDGRCAICCEILDEGKLTHLDHDHLTGAFRGILCSNCNTGLGMFKDSPRLLAMAIVYLESHGKVF